MCVDLRYSHLSSDIALGITITLTYKMEHIDQ